MSHLLPNYALLLFWSIFGLIHRKILFLVQKSDYLRKEYRNSHKKIFLNKFEKGKSLGKFGFV